MGERVVQAPLADRAAGAAPSGDLDQVDQLEHRPVRAGVALVVAEVNPTVGCIV